MTIVRNKFEVWSFSLRPELKQCCTSTSCESWPRTPQHEEPFLYLSLVAFILKRRSRSSNTHFEMVNEPLSFAAWRSFDSRDRTEEDWLMKLASIWKICGQSMTKRRFCTLKNISQLCNRIAHGKRSPQWIQHNGTRSLPETISFFMLDYKKTCGFVVK